MCVGCLLCNAGAQGVSRHYLLYRFFFGKNKVMTVAMGTDEKTEYKDNLHLLAKVCLEWRFLALTRNEFVVVCEYMC